MEAYALTDVGRVRAHNQDYIYSSSTPVGSLNNLFLVADGMGGHQAGDYASRFAVEHLIGYAARQVDGQTVRILQDGITLVNRELYEKSRTDERLAGMGTTLVAATVEGSTLYVANVGDSRLYLQRGDQLKQITRDHSYVEELVALGRIERNSQAYLEKKNIITRALGTRSDVDVDFFEEELLPGDRLLLCSDGLSNMLKDEELCHWLASLGTLKEKVEGMIASANDRGGFDNIAVILVEPQISEVASC